MSEQSPIPIEESEANGSKSPKSAEQETQERQCDEFIEDFKNGVSIKFRKIERLKTYAPEGKQKINDETAEVISLIATLEEQAVGFTTANKRRASQLVSLAERGLSKILGPVQPTENSVDQATSVVPETQPRVEASEKIDVDWLRETCETMEGIDDFVADKPEIFPGESRASLERKINKETSDPDLRESLINELNARAYLHDAYIVFAVANYEIEPIVSNFGYLNLDPGNFETLFHGMRGVRELVPIALSMFEMAMKQKLPGFEGENFTPASWRTFKGDVEREVGKRLGKNGPIAAKLAGRLVEATGMPAYYEDKFGFDKSMPQRDVMNTEGRRMYYGRANRLDRTGKRYHGFTSTVGVYWNEPGAVNEEGKLLNPVITVNHEPGEPNWDLVPDYWMNARIIDPTTQETERFNDIADIVGYKAYDADKDEPGVVIEDKHGNPDKISYGPIKTLSGRNRYVGVETPNFIALQRKLRSDTGDPDILTDQDIESLKKLPWGEAHVAKYENFDFVNDGGRAVVKNHGYRSWAEQLEQRLLFHKMITDPEGPSVGEIASGSWIAKNQTTTDYLTNSAYLLRDLQEEDLYKKVRMIQTLFLWSIFRHRSPAIQPDPDLYVKPQNIRDAIRRASREGYVSENQAAWLMREAHVKGAASKASVMMSVRTALERIGLPGA